uniref:ABC transporter n=1 Tax=Noctiluca scintillans TaxID=2966 RepID=A0A7S1AFC4_NOCSC|mmetsp:Transcript_44068/g.116543  ORF Transcript_44068/g.116543 Transcript_44068/m.116543 type:complete len:583 (+) Transcript_44068:83-1831(+)
MSDPGSFLLPHLRPEAPRLLLGAGALLAASFVNFRTGAQLRGAIESNAGHGHLVRSLAFFGAGALAGCIRTFVIDSVTEKVRVSIATEVFSAWLHAEPDSHQGQADETDGADAESEEKMLETSQPRARTAVALDSDVTLCSTAVPMCSTIVRYTSSVVGGTIAMFRSSWKMSAFVWPLLVTGSMYGARAGGKTAGKSARQIADARADAFGFAEERLQNRNLVRWFTRADREANSFREKCQVCIRMVSKTAAVRGVFHLCFDLIAKGLLMGLCALGGYLVKKGELTAGEVTEFFFHAMFLGLGLYGLLDQVPKVADIREAAKRLSCPPVTSSPKQDGEIATVPQSVNFNDVSFIFPGRSRKILDRFTLEIPAGTTCALVGPSGSGKTTVASLLLHDYDVTSGEILVGGSNIQNTSREFTRSNLGVLPQQPGLLGSSVSDAIKFGCEEATDKDVEVAARRACAHDFVSERQGYTLPVSDLSVGERQRVALARAFVRKRHLLVLDEPMSALDAPTAATLTESLLGSGETATMLIITHKLSLIQRCDKVAVMSGGRVVQHGSFSELAAEKTGPLASIIESGVVKEA